MFTYDRFILEDRLISQMRIIQDLRTLMEGTDQLDLTTISKIKTICDYYDMQFDETYRIFEVMIREGVFNCE